MPALLGSVPSVDSVLSVDSVSSVLSECSVPSVESEEFCCLGNLRKRESGRRAFVKLALFSLRGERNGRKKVFFQNEAIAKLPISS